MHPCLPPPSPLQKRGFISRCGSPGVTKKQKVEGEASRLWTWYDHTCGDVYKGEMAESRRSHQAVPPHWPRASKRTPQTGGGGTLLNDGFWSQDLCLRGNSPGGGTKQRSSCPPPRSVLLVASASCPPPPSNPPPLWGDAQTPFSPHPPPLQVELGVRNLRDLPAACAEECANAGLRMNVRRNKFLLGEAGEDEDDALYVRFDAAHVREARRALEGALRALGPPRAPADRSWGDFLRGDFVAMTPAALQRERQSAGYQQMIAVRRRLPAFSMGYSICCAVQAAQVNHCSVFNTASHRGGPVLGLCPFGWLGWEGQCDRGTV